MWQGYLVYPLTWQSAAVETVLRQYSFFNCSSLDCCRNAMSLLHCSMAWRCPSYLAAAYLCQKLPFCSTVLHVGYFLLLLDEAKQPVYSMLLQQGCSWHLHKFRGSQMGYSCTAVSVLVLILTGQHCSYKQSCWCQCLFSIGFPQYSSESPRGTLPLVFVVLWVRLLELIVFCFCCQNKIFLKIL